MEKWVTFVGEGRSGHTIISAILDSHPHVRISEEQKYISKWCRESWSRQRIIDELLKSGYGKERKPKALPGMLKYTAPLLAIGDKCGWDAVNEFRKRDAPADILVKFGEFMEMPVKTIVTMRHPLDNITAWVNSPKYKRLFTDDGLRYRRMIRRYKQFHDAAWEVLQHTDYFILNNEEIIARPNETIQKLAEFLEIPAEKSWRRPAAKSVLAKPHQRRGEVEWPEEYVKRVTDFIESNSLLEYYR